MDVGEIWEDAGNVRRLREIRFTFSASHCVSVVARDTSVSVSYTHLDVYKRQG